MTNPKKQQKVNEGRICLQGIFDNPKGPMEENFKSKVLSEHSQPKEWDDDTTLLMWMAFTYFSRGWDAKKF